MRKLAIKYGINTSAAVVLVLGIVVLIEIISNLHHKRFDYTTAKRYTISEESKKVLDSLEQNIKVTAFFNESQRGEIKVFQDLLDQYAYHSSKFSFEFIDPDKKPGKARRYKIDSYGTTVVENGKKEEKIFDTREEKLTNAILKVTQKGKKVVYFSKGHGEKNIDNINEQGFSFAKKAIELSNYEVRDIVLAVTETIPKDANLLIIAGPQKPILNTELETIRKYADDGGKIFFMIDPGTSSELTSFLENFGISIENNIVVDKVSRVFGVDPSMPVVTQYGEHPIVKDFSMATFFPLTRSVNMTINSVKGISVTSLIKTTDNSWAETDFARFQNGEAAYDEGEDRKGPISIGVVASLNKKEKKQKKFKHAFDPKEPETDKDAKEGRIVAIGDSDFASNSRINILGNSDFFLNIINWLLEEEDLISIKPRELEGKIFTLTKIQQKLIFWIPLVAMPGIFIIAGIVVFKKRKSMK